MTVSPAYVVASTIGRVMPHHSFRQVLCKPSFRSCYFQKEGDVTVPLGALLAAEVWHQLLPCGQHGRHVFVDSCRNKSLNSHACTISETLFNKFIFHISLFLLCEIPTLKALCIQQEASIAAV